MPIIEWSDDYKTGNRDIDKDHWGLFALINDLNDKVADGVAETSIAVTLEALAVYVDVHFEREEALMEACGYEGLAEHKILHRRLADKVRAYEAAYRNDPTTFDYADFIGFLAYWLKNHILVSDMDYVPAIHGSVSEARGSGETG